MKIRLKGASFSDTIEVQQQEEVVLYDGEAGYLRWSAEGMAYRGTRVYFGDRLWEQVPEKTWQPAAVDYDLNRKEYIVKPLGEGGVRLRLIEHGWYVAEELR